MKELAILSGKGGTGKTTLTASFATLTNSLIADCDVEAPDLDLILDPSIEKEKEFYGQKTALKDNECINCGRCKEACRFNSIDESYEINSNKCEGCGACVYVCPQDSIELKDKKTGEIYTSSTKFGKMIHSKLNVGEEASGKLVAEVKKTARENIKEEDYLLIDGSPGIGCSVISSIGGTDFVLIVTEPTFSGIHDLKRVLELVRHFGINSGVVVNKYDINPKNTEKIKEICEEKNIPLLGKLPYDEEAIESMLNAESVVEYSDSELSSKIKGLWKKLKKEIK